MSAKTPSRDKRPKQVRLQAPVRRERILEAAMQIFAERRYHAPMGEIAAASGVTRTVLYHYFESKPALFRAVLERQAAELVARVAPATTSDGTQRERLRELDAVLAFAEEQPLAWDTLFRRGDEDEAEVREARTRVLAVSTASLIAMIGEDIEAAGAAPGDPAVQMASEHEALRHALRRRRRRRADGHLRVHREPPADPVGRPDRRTRLGLHRAADDLPAGQAQALPRAVPLARPVLRAPQPVRRRLRASRRDEDPHPRGHHGVAARRPARRSLVRDGP